MTPGATVKPEEFHQYPIT